MRHSVTLSQALASPDRMMMRALPMFSGLSEHDFSRIAGAAFAGTLDAKTTIFHEGDPAHDVYIVVEGWAKLYRITPDGEEAIINVFSRGQSFAEAVAFSSARYPASAEAISECRLIRVPAITIIHAIRDNSDVALSMLASTTVHLQRLVGEIARLKGLNGFARVIEFLNSLEVSKDGREMNLPFEKQTLARHLGMQPESLSRTFRKLKDYGIEVDNARVTLERPDALKRAAEDSAL